MTGRKRILLGVNIDHVATLRQARRGVAPDLMAAAAAAVKGGADGITAHLREDRRHIQDADILRLAEAYRLNLEMAATDEMVRIASSSPRPHSVCLVPEKREELTTEGGLNVVGHEEALKSAVGRLRDAGIVVSLFVEPDSGQIEAAARTGAEFVELHTGTYANLPGVRVELERLLEGARRARALGLRVNAGHGLDLSNVGPVLALEGLEELNIGFSLVARAVFVGLEVAVREMKGAIA